MRSLKLLAYAGVCCFAIVGPVNALTPTPTPTRTKMGTPATPTPGGSGLVFNLGTVYTVPDNVQALTTADFDLDGQPDIALVSFPSRSVTVMLGTGTGEFTQLLTTDTFGSFPNGIAAADLNGDGVPDLAVTDRTASNLVVLLGQGNGFLGQPSSFRSGKFPIGVVTGQFDGNPGIDVALADSLDSTVSVFFNSDSPTHAVAFSSPLTLSSQTPSLIGTADFNEDGNPDLVAIDTGGIGASNARLFIGDGQGGFQSVGKFALGDGVQNLAIADFNDDQVPDLAVTNARVTNAKVVTSAVTFLLADGKGSFIIPQTGGEIAVDCTTLAAPVCSPVGIAAADFNLDGETDLAVAVDFPLAGGSTVLIYPGNGDGSFGDPIDVADLTFAVTDMISLDLNSDGTPDLVVGGGISVEAVLNFSTPPPTATPTAPQNLTPAATGSVTVQPPGTGTPGKPNGSPCGSGPECASGVCTGGICQASSGGSSVGRSGGCATTNRSDAASWMLLAVPVLVWLKRSRS